MVCEVRYMATVTVVESAVATMVCDVRRWIRLYGAAWAKVSPVGARGLVTVALGVDPVHGGRFPDDFRAEVIAFGHGDTETGAIVIGGSYGRPIDGITWTVRIVTNYVGGRIRVEPLHPYMGVIEIPIATDPYVSPYAIPGPDPEYPTGGNA
jgi:hypothetical protein